MNLKYQVWFDGNFIQCLVIEDSKWLMSHLLTCMKVYGVRSGGCHGDTSTAQQITSACPVAEDFFLCWTNCWWVYTYNTKISDLVLLFLFHLQSSELLPYFHWTMWNFSWKNCLYSRPRSWWPTNSGTAPYLCRTPSVWGSIYTMLKPLFKFYVAYYPYSMVSCPALHLWEIIVLFLIDVGVTSVFDFLKNHYIWPWLA